MVRLDFLALTRDEGITLCEPRMMDIIKTYINYTERNRSNLGICRYFTVPSNARSLPNLWEDPRYLEIGIEVARFTDHGISDRRVLHTYIFEPRGPIQLTLLLHYGNPYENTFVGL